MEYYLVDTGRKYDRIDRTPCRDCSRIVRKLSRMSGAVIAILVLVTHVGCCRCVLTSVCNIRLHMVIRMIVVVVYRRISVS